MKKYNEKVDDWEDIDCHSIIGRGRYDTWLKNILPHVDQGTRNVIAVSLETRDAEIEKLKRKQNHA